MILTFPMMRSMDSQHDKTLPLSFIQLVYICDHLGFFKRIFVGTKGVNQASISRMKSCVFSTGNLV